MEKIKSFINSKFFVIACFIVYCTITITRIFNHTPWFDEAHSWTIAQQLNYFDLFNYVKNEGHFFIWQTLLYPFAHSNIIPYPYPMQILNWTFCTLALILLWWKAPFNNIVKALIMFSFPFLGCYAILARCYSIGILLLFILTIMNKNKLKYPKTYALLLILCANTSVMALIGTTALGVLFLVDLYKNRLNKKNNIIVGGILLLGTVLILYQLLNMGYYEPISSNRPPHVSVRIFRNTFIYGQLILNLLILSLFSIPVFRYFYEDKKTLFFISFSYFWLLIFGTCVYGGSFWHSYFFYIYLIIAFWLCDKKVDDLKLKNYAIITFSIISLIFVIHKPVNKDYYQCFKIKSYDLIKAIESDEILSHADIIQNGGTLYVSIPYSVNKTYTLRNHCHIEKNTDYDLLNSNNKICRIGNSMSQAKFKPDEFKTLINDNTYTFIDTTEYKIDRNLEVVKGKNYSIYFEKYKCFGDYCFWKIYVK